MCERPSEPLINAPHAHLSLLVAHRKEPPRMVASEAQEPQVRLGHPRLRDGCDRHRRLVKHLALARAGGGRGALLRALAVRVSYPSLLVADHHLHRCLGHCLGWGELKGKSPEHSTLVHAAAEEGGTVLHPDDVVDPEAAASVLALVTLAHGAPRRLHDERQRSTAEHRWPRRGVRRRLIFERPRMLNPWAELWSVEPPHLDGAIDTARCEQVARGVEIDREHRVEMARRATKDTDAFTRKDVPQADGLVARAREEERGRARVEAQLVDRRT